MYLIIFSLSQSANQSVISHRITYLACHALRCYYQIAHRLTPLENCKL